MPPVFLVLGYLFTVVILSASLMSADLSWRVLMAGLLLVAIFPLIGYVQVRVHRVQRHVAALVRVAVFAGYSLSGGFLFHDIVLEDLIVPPVGQTTVLNAVPFTVSGGLYGLIGYAVSCLASRIVVYVVARYRPVVDARQCEHCGYDLTGNVSGICPECGRPIREDSGK